MLARFPFTDQTGTKLRPVLVLAEIPGPYRDFIVLFISSQLSQRTPALDSVIDAGHPAFRLSGLKVPSVFRIAKVASLSETLLIGTIGHLDRAVFDDIIQRLTRLLEGGRLQR